MIGLSILFPTRSSYVQISCRYLWSKQPSHTLSLCVILLLSAADAGIENTHQGRGLPNDLPHYSSGEMDTMKIYSSAHHNHYRKAKNQRELHSQHYNIAAHGNYVGGAGDVFIKRSGHVSNFSDFVDTPFENNTSTSSTVPIGDTAFLKCTVKNLGNRTISWIRRRDMHIISVDRIIYTNDERFNILRVDGSDDWILQIKYVQKRDNGTYECQVSAGRGISSFAVNLFVVVPEAFILGNGEYHIREGSTINLVCIVEKSPKPPEYIFWYHNNRMINYGSERDLSIQTETGSKTQSRLIINKAKMTDSGNYTCETANADPASTIVYISQGDKMAAIQRRKSDSTTGTGSTSPDTISSSASPIFQIYSVSDVPLTSSSFPLFHFAILEMVLKIIMLLFILLLVVSCTTDTTRLLLSSVLIVLLVNGLISTVCLTKASSLAVVFVIVIFLCYSTFELQLPLMESLAYLSNKHL